MDAAIRGFEVLAREVMNLRLTPRVEQLSETEKQRLAERVRHRRFALRRADRAKHIGGGEPEILWRCWPATGLPPHPGEAVLLANPRLIGEPQFDSLTACLLAPDSL